MLELSAVATTCRPELHQMGNAIDQLKFTAGFHQHVQPGNGNILQGNLYGYKGAIFENLVADILARWIVSSIISARIRVWKSILLQDTKANALVEVKASNGNIKSAKTILSNPEKYHVSQAIKLEM